MRGLGRPEIGVRAVTPDDADALAEMHADAFRRGWSAAEFEALLLQPGLHGHFAHYRSAFGRTSRAGFSVYRIAADEAELLSIAVVGGCRRRGVARRLMEEMLRHLYRERIATVHLEVEEANDAAIRLYRAFEFEPVGQRPGYYRQARSAPRGALVMRRVVV